MDQKTHTKDSKTIQEPEVERDSVGQLDPASTFEKKNLKEAHDKADKAAKAEKDAEKGVPHEKHTAPPGAKTSPPQDYEAMTVPELRELAKERDVEIGWHARKDEIVTALEKDDKNKK